MHKSNFSADPPSLRYLQRYEYALNAGLFAVEKYPLLHEPFLAIAVSILHRVQLVHQARLLASRACVIVASTSRSCASGVVAGTSRIIASAAVASTSRSHARVIVASASGSSTSAVVASTSRASASCAATY